MARRAGRTAAPFDVLPLSCAEESRGIRSGATRTKRRAGCSSARIYAQVIPRIAVLPVPLVTLALLLKSLPASHEFLS